MTTTNTVNISEIRVSTTDNTKTSWGVALSTQYFFAYANGGAGSEQFDANDLTTATKNLMASYKRGVGIKMGAGDDTVIGSAYGDTINGGAGINKIDGGDNQGTDPNGYKARDILNVFVASQAAADAISITAIAETGADAALYAEGYRIKVVNASGNETSYLKGVEQVNVFLSTTNAFLKAFDLTTRITEAASTDNVTNYMHLAWVQGTSFNDTFSAATDISADTLTRMGTAGRGVWVDMGAGNDTVTGSQYGDNITVGTGTNYVDGGANNGSPPFGGKAMDVLHLHVTSLAAADAIQVTQLTSALADADLAAFNNGYTHKVVNGSEVDYIKNIERINVQLASGNTLSYVKDIPLVVVVNEANLSDANIGQMYHLAWVNGTAGVDTIDLSGDTALLSSALKTALGTHSRGVWISGGAGNDIITGTAYGDNFVNGSGNSKIDGGGNAGPNGTKSQDVFEVRVATTAEMAAVTVSASDDVNYTWMVEYGNGQKDYLKNVEAVSINVNGTSTGKWIPLVVNVGEIASNGNLTTSMHYAWANGTDRDDSFVASTDVSSATNTLMTNNQRGVWVDLGAGNDSVTGSGFGDDITVGTGTNYVDGGANAGSPPWGGNAQDVLHVRVASSAAADAVAVTQLTGTLAGTDLAAQAAGYTHKVVNGTEVDYIKGIERISIELQSGNTTSFVRDIPLTVVVHEASASDPNFANFYHLAFVNGTAGGDAIDLSGTSPLLSSAIRTSMQTNGRGAWINGGAGNDTITGTAYADNIRNGDGNSFVDGGANGGPGGVPGQDVFEIVVADTAAMSAVTVAVSDDVNYKWMITYGPNSSQKDYLKNVEAVVVNVNGTTTGKWIPLEMSVREIAANGPLSGSMHYAWVNGTDQAETFNAGTDITSATRTLMTNNGRGVYVDMGAGNDTVVGSGYGDNFVGGAGTNYIDGGANAGSPPFGGKAQDVLQVNVADQAAAAAVSVTALTGTLAGTDATAATAGYTHKVSSPVGTDYIKGIEKVTVSIVSGNTHTFVRDIPLTVVVNEVSLTDPNLANMYHLAYVNGTGGADTIDMSGDTALLSTAMKAALDSNKRGVWVSGGAGDDTVTGTGYADTFVNGAGNSKIDGGANAGPANANSQDMFQITVATAAEMSAVTVSASDDANYTYMVTYGPNSTQKDYLKNVEGININVNGTTTGRYIPLAVSVGEVPSNGNLANFLHFAFVNGTAQDDSYTAPQGISTTTQGLMATHGRGIVVDTGAGNDTITGTGFGDNFLAGSGTNYIDGGANVGTQPGGAAARDVVEMFVASQADADAVTVVALASTSTGADLAAWNNGYKYKISNGTSEIDYVKNVEQLRINIWQDKDNDGQRDYSNDANNEVTFARMVGLLPNGAPTFGSPAGTTYQDAATGLSPSGALVLSNGKILTISFLNEGSGEGNLYLAVTMTNADGTVDTTFGTAGILKIPTSFGVVPAPVLQPDGKVLVPMSTWLTNGDFQVLRLNANGTVDTAFGTNGFATIALSAAHDEPREALLQADGKIILAGFADIDGNRDFAVTRFLANGALDTSFNGTGHLIVPVGTLQDQVNTAALADGKILLVGRSVITTGNRDISLVRVNADGTLDTSFGTGGKVVIPDSTKDDIALSVAVQADGKVLVGGVVYSNVNNVVNEDAIILRLNTDGSLDTTWGTGGKVMNLATPIGELTVAIEVQSDGKVVTLSDSEAGLVVQRFNSNGTPDGLFGVNGKVTLPGRGHGENGASLMLTGGKILVVGTSNLANTASQFMARLNSDGSFDTSFNPTGGNSLGGSSTGNGLGTYVIDPNGTIFDAELASTGNYAGAVLTVARQGGANAEDAFGFAPGVSVSNGTLMVGNATDGMFSVGTVVNAAGQLQITFNAGATQGRVNTVLESIGYANKNLVNPPTSVTLAWTLSDGNSGTQGFGGAGTATATSVVNIGVVISETARQFVAPTKDLFNNLLADRIDMAQVAGTARAETFDSATAFSGAVQSLMAEFKRGAVIDMGAGNDTIIGTAYNDFIIPGSGINRVDGGGNEGMVGGDSSNDHVRVYVPTLDAAKAAAVVPLSSGSTGDDLAAFQAGYEAKIVHGTDTTYIKNVEAVSVSIWNDANANGIRDGGELTVFKNIRVGLIRSEFPANTTSSFQVNAVSGYKNDTFTASTDISSAGLATMATNKKGVWLDMGAGDDTAVGSAHPDNFIMGSGTNYVDGGAHTAPVTVTFRDALEIFVADQAAANAVVATLLTTGMSGADAAAYSNGYTHKVVSPNATDYLKNVETINIQIWNDKDGDGQRDFNADAAINEVTYARQIKLALQVSETLGANANAYVEGSLSNESFNATADLSTGMLDALAAAKRGAFIDMRGGNDTVVGTGFSDTVIGGSGTNMIDGGANVAPTGQFGADAVEVYVPDQAAAQAVAVTQLDATSTGADASAFAAGYVFKVVAGNETDYLKNMEQVRINIWNDKDGDGQRDFNSDATLNEVTGFKTVFLTPSTYETKVSTTDATKDTNGNVLTTLGTFTSINGTIFNDDLDPAVLLSQPARDLMAEFGKGIFIDGGVGNDRITGSDFADNFVPGSGINYVDGKGEIFKTGFRQQDVVEVYVATQAEADAATVVELTSAATGTDGDAYAAGYRFKVVAGSETDYLKGVETLRLSIWNDKDSDGARDYNSNATLNEVTFVKEVRLGFSINEVIRSTTDATKDSSGNLLTSLGHFAWAYGGPYSDHFDVAALSQATRDLMALHKRGVYIEGGNGNDVATGSAYGDDFIMGAGVNKVDGGLNEGTDNHGNDKVDRLQVRVANQAAADAVTVVKLNSSSTGADLAAWQEGFTHKVLAGAETDYIKGIEDISISIFNDTNNNGVQDNGETIQFVRSVPMGIRVSGPSVSSTNPNNDSSGHPLSDYSQFGYVAGTADDDVVTPADLPASLLSVMDRFARGVNYDLGAGNDTVTGSVYGDYFNVGAGINMIDGGANKGGTTYDDGPARDELNMIVNSQATADGVTVTELTSAMTGADGDAYAAGYRFKVANGTVEVNYLKNVEQVHIQIWTDKDNDGKIDYTDVSATHEVSYARGINLMSNTAPNFRPSPGVAIYGSGKDYYSIGGIMTEDGKWLTLSNLNDQPGTANYRLVLTKANPDMTLDSSFGTNGLANFPYAYRSVANPAMTADGKILVAFTSPAGDFQVVRLNANGSVDSSFGTAGTTSVAMGSAFDGATSLLVQGDGKIVIAGNAGSTATDFGVVRLNADGTPDTGFNGTGKLVLDVNGDKDIVRAIASQPDGKLILAGRALNGANSDVAVVRLNANGTVDTSFGGGEVLLPVGAGNDGAVDVKVMPDGSILVAGWTLSGAANTTDEQPMLVRLNANGTLMSSFAAGGKLVLAGGTRNDWIQDVAIQPDGKILVLAMVDGDLANSMGQRVVVARFHNDGALDYSFGINGKRELALQGIADQANTIVVRDGKIHVFGSTSNDTNFNTSNAFIQLNMDGSMDASFPPTPPFTTGGGTFATGVDPFVLDINAAIYDAELSADGSYGGSRLLIQRQGGANADDVFTAVGEVQFNSGRLIVGGIDIGAVTNANGQLIFNFDGESNQGLVNRAMHGIAYTNSNPNQPASVALLWNFSDNNSGNQGYGGPLAHNALQTINFSWVKTETIRSFMDPLKSSAGETLANKLFLARVDGSERAESFAYNAGGGAVGFFSQANRDLMAEFQRGAHYNMRGGDDTVTGTPYCDEFITGSGINRVDGGTNLGSSWMNGQPSRDILRILVADQSQGQAVQFVVLKGDATGDDLTAFQDGYELKVVNGSTVDYVKNVEEVTVETTAGAWVKNFVMDLDIYERKVHASDPTKDENGNAFATAGHMAYAYGWTKDDQFDANNLSTAVKQLMSDYSKGVYIFGGAGADGLFGSSHSDVLIGGSSGGTFNRLDGRGGFDFAEVFVANQSAANAVTATLLAGSSDATDVAAAGLGFVYKLASPSTGEVSYLRDIESVRVLQWNDTNGNGRVDEGTSFFREIPLALKVDGVKLDPNDATKAADGRTLASIAHFGWADGGLLADNFNASTDMPASITTLMNTHSRGVAAFLGGGNDTAVGTGFGDHFNMGGGTNYVKGGANTGTDPQGNAAADVLEIFIANAGDASNVIRSTLTGTGSTEDIAAHTAGYTNKVVYGTQVHYLQDVEKVMLQVWNDADGDGMRDYGDAEVTFVSLIGINDPA